MFSPHRDIEQLNDIEFHPSAALHSIMAQFSSVSDKPVSYRLIDSRNSTYFSGVREFTDRFVIWFDPSTERLDYALAHEYAHAITMNDPASSYLDPRPAANQDLRSRHIAQLAASVIDHGQVHSVLTAAGLDTEPEALAKTADVLKKLTPTLASQVSDAAAAGDRGALAFVFNNADMLTTFACSATPRLHNAMRKFFAAPFNALVDLAVRIVERRALGELDNRRGAVALLEVIGCGDLSRYYVTAELYRANLERWSP